MSLLERRRSHHNVIASLANLRDQPDGPSASSRLVSPVPIHPIFPHPNFSATSTAPSRCSLVSLVYFRAAKTDGGTGLTRVPSSPWHYKYLYPFPFPIPSYFVLYLFTLSLSRLAQITFLRFPSIYILDQLSPDDFYLHSHSPLVN